MKQSVRLIFSLALTAGACCSYVYAQDPVGAPQFRSRSEYLAERRRVENAFPDLIRALRTLHLPPDKMSEAEEKLRRSEVETRAAREELRSLSEKRDGQDFERRSTNSSRIAELRTSLQTSSAQLHSDLKALLTPQQRDQFDRQLRRSPRERGTKSTGSHPTNSHR